MANFINQPILVLGAIFLAGFLLDRNPLSPDK